MQWRFFDIGFRPADVPDELNACRLAVSTPDGREEIIGPIGDLRPEPVAAGKVRINIDHADFEEGKVEFSVFNFRIPYDRVRLDVGNGRALEPRGWARSDSYPHWFRLRFPVRDVETDPESWRLVVEVPTDSVRHTLRATLRNVGCLVGLFGFIHRPMRFDRISGRITWGRLWRKHQRPLSDIAAVQLIPGRYVEGDHESPGYPPYEINVVFSDGMRQNASRHADLWWTRQAATCIANFLDVPLLEGRERS